MGFAKSIIAIIIVAFLVAIGVACYLYFRDKRRRENFIRRVSGKYSGNHHSGHHYPNQQAQPINPGAFNGQVTTYAVVPQDPSHHHVPGNVPSAYPNRNPSPYPTVSNEPYPSKTMSPYPVSYQPGPAAYPSTNPAPYPAGYPAMHNTQISAMQDPPPYYQAGAPANPSAPARY